MSQATTKPDLDEYLLFLGRSSFAELGERLAHHPHGARARDALFALAQGLATKAAGSKTHCAVCDDTDNPASIDQWRHIAAVWLLPGSAGKWLAQPVCFDCCPSEEVVSALAADLPAVNHATSDDPYETWTGVVRPWDWSLRDTAVQQTGM